MFFGPNLGTRNAKNPFVPFKDPNSNQKTAKLKKILSFNTLASSRIQGFSEKKHLNARGFAREFLQSSMLYRPGENLKHLGKSSSPHSKKIFCLGMRVFCEWHHKWMSFRAPWPTLPGPGHQPLGGSISLKFLLETRLRVNTLRTGVRYIRTSISA